MNEFIYKLASPKKPKQAAAILIAVSTAYRVIVGSLFSPAVDEAYYWEWSRRLALGYFDHPPLTAWIIRASTSVFGSSPFGVRLGAAIWGAGFLLLVFLFARRTTDELTAWRILAAVALAPLFVLGIGVMTLPETALALPWALALTFAASIAFDRPTALRWIGFGAAVGLGMLGKVTAVLLPGGFGLFLLLAPKQRRKLLDVSIIPAIAVAVLVFAPFLYWNHLNGWPSFSFMGTRVATKTVFHFTRAYQIQLGQVAFISPLLWLGAWIGMIWSARKYLAERDERLLFLLCFSAPAIIGFDALAIIKKVLPHWAALGFVTALAAGVIWAQNHRAARDEAGRRRFDRIVIIGFAIAMFGNLVAPLAVLVPAAPAAIKFARDNGLVSSQKRLVDPMGDIFGFEQAGDYAMKLLDEGWPDPATVPILSYHWGVSGRLSYGLRDRRETYTVGSKANQYRFWVSDEEFIGGDALLVRDEMFRSEFAEHFTCRSLEEAPPIDVIWKGYPIRRWYFARCRELLSIRRD